jgi:predicted esterase
MNLHENQPILTAGPKPEDAETTLILLHGRGADAADILGIYAELKLPNIAALAPDAAGHQWYPQSFLAPIEQNQPYLDSALALLANMVGDLIQRGIPCDRIAFLGFSQGACLTSEFIARNPQRYKAALALTGGVIGAPGQLRSYEGDLAGTPVFLGTSDPDPHVPFSRVKETEAILKQLGATVEVRRYPGMPHTVNYDELEVCMQLLGGS